MYEAFYKLQKKPFQLSPDPEFFFNSAVHKRALAYLRYGLAQGEGFIVVTGSPGTGKTMLVKELFQELKQENIVAGLMVTTHVEPDDTLRIVAASFGLSHDGTKASLLKDLEEFFRAKAREGKRILLIIDEAQNLPLKSLEELRMLTNFELNGKPLFQTFLLGQDEFRMNLQKDVMDQFRQRVTATYNLRPLERDEIKPYIIHRLKTAGWQNDPEVKDDAFGEIFDFTGGVPRIINTLCERILLFGFLEELHVIDSQSVKTVVQEIEKEEMVNFEKKAKPQFVSNRNFNDIPIAVNQGGTIEQRVQYLESTVEALRRALLKERALLRKAILIQLDMDDAYDASDSGMDN